MTTHIQTIVEKYTGTSVGVSFTNGVGHADSPSAIAYFERQGYDVTPECPPNCSTGEVTVDGDKGKGPTPKEKAQAAAAKLGLDTSGTKEEISERIKLHKATQNAPEVKTPPAKQEEKPADGDKGAESKGSE